MLTWVKTRRVNTAQKQERPIAHSIHSVGCANWQGVTLISKENAYNKYVRGYPLVHNSIIEIISSDSETKENPIVQSHVTIHGLNLHFSQETIVNTKHRWNFRSEITCKRTPPNLIPRAHKWGGGSCKEAFLLYQDYYYVIKIAISYKCCKSSNESATKSRMQEPH